ncbi:MAG TPA: glycine dehydrogenase (aminomethyl-transferring), partial [Xanthomonadales bacterium]|nr:glycine dehydrogenase (aminomethyl-transferring) [Xanthomonadales bacterium]
LEEIERFIEAMLSIREEIRAVESGLSDRQDNPLKNAPHPVQDLAGEWSHTYTREQAAYPVRTLHHTHKFWTSVSRIDNVYGDRNLVCSCPPMEDWMD